MEAETDSEIEAPVLGVDLAWLRIS